MFNNKDNKIITRQIVFFLSFNQYTQNLTLKQNMQQNLQKNYVFNTNAARPILNLFFLDNAKFMYVCYILNSIMHKYLILKDMIHRETYIIGIVFT